MMHLYVLYFAYDQDDLCWKIEWTKLIIKTNIKYPVTAYSNICVILCEWFLKAQK